SSKIWVKSGCGSVGRSTSFTSSNRSLPWSPSSVGGDATELSFGADAATDYVSHAEGGGAIAEKQEVGFGYAQPPVIDYAGNRLCR
ncbi:MAG: hypothetical protein AAFO83_16355, partial [Cyanobacteria bacterium J06607_13]